MMNQIKTVFRNSRETLVQDALGGAVLVALMLIALHFPGFS